MKMKHKLAMVALSGLAALVPTIAHADSCANVSRAPAACGFSCPGPVFQGHWVWLPSIGVPVAAWGFAPPGMNGTNGNYQNQAKSGATEAWLLENSAICAGKVPNRQQAHGIQSGCGS
jgi:hypothetical protein